jgi:hypothetical protein
MQARKNAKMKKLIVAVGHSAARATGTRRMKRAPAAAVARLGRRYANLRASRRGWGTGPPSETSAGPNRGAGAGLRSGLAARRGSDESRGTLAYVDAVLADRDAEERFRQALAHASLSAYFQARLHLAFASGYGGSDARPRPAPACDPPSTDSKPREPSPGRNGPRQELRASGETHGAPQRLHPQGLRLRALVFVVAAPPLVRLRLRVPGG